MNLLSKIINFSSATSSRANDYNNNSQMVLLYSSALNIIRIYIGYFHYDYLWLMCGVLDAQKAN